jgi:hypothetical protein
LLKEDNQIQDDSDIDENILRKTYRKIQFKAVSQKYIGVDTSDDEFKENYKNFNPNILKKKSTLVLKTSFHLINYVLMGMCQMFKYGKTKER